MANERGVWQMLLTIRFYPLIRFAAAAHFAAAIRCRGFVHSHPFVHYMFVDTPALDSAAGNTDNYPNQMRPKNAPPCA